LLVIDAINPFDFPGGAAFAKRALRAAHRIARLKARAHAARVPVIYVNDNFGKWRSDLAALVAFCSRPGMPGAGIVKVLEPTPADYVVLKSTLSGFYQTPLDAMLRLGGVRHLVIAGYAADNCVLFTAADAYMRDFKLSVPSDCVASQTAEIAHTALRSMKRLFGAATGSSAKLRLSRLR
jgi:nicotinamidase-related amidase